MRERWRMERKALLGLILFLSVFLWGDLSAKAGNCDSHITGYSCPGHGHSFEALSTCSKCQGTGSISTAANGWLCKNCRLFHKDKPTTTKCQRCNYSGTAFGGWYEAGTGSISSTCDRCSGHGRNTRCKNGSCGYSSYGWHNGGSVSGICYRCSGCQAVTGDHESAGGATCTAGEICRYCGTSLRDALGHSWGSRYVSGTRWVRACTRSGCAATRDEGSAQYTVSFQGNGGTNVSVSSKAVVYGSGYGSLPSATRTGYSLGGWWTAASGGTQIGPGSLMQRAENHTLYAHWTANSYTVSFHGNGGTASTAGRTVIYDTGNWNQGAATASRTGYTFLGYYSAPSGGIQVYDHNGNAVDSSGYWSGSGSGARWRRAGNVTLYAQWRINTYTVSYEANGGAEVQKESESVTYNTFVNLNYKALWRAGEPDEEDFVFIGWNTDPHADEGLESYRLPARDVTLYAIWSIPVSNVKEVYLGAWPKSLPEAQRTVRNGKFYHLQTDRITSRGYYNSIQSTRVADAFGGEAVDVCEYAWDYAANVSIYGEASPVIPWYQQTTHHMYYDMAKKGWTEFDVTGVMALEGSSYTPSHITPPQGYRTDAVDPPYVVEQDRDTYAYYRPLAYTLFYDANGGSCETTEREIVFGSLYGAFPAARRFGYTFTGWYTQREEGTRVRSKDTYQIAGDSTVYAQWKANVHQVQYDYGANGGASAGETTARAAFGERVRLDISAVKEGWEHIGWNTDPEAVRGLDTVIMGDEDIILYAIYRKSVTASFVDRKDEGPVTRTDTKTIYNREAYATISVPKMHSWTGWRALGFSRDSDPEGIIEASEGASVSLEQDTVFYGIYQRDIKVAYDTNGSGEELLEESKPRLYNAGDHYRNPEFVLQEAPALEGSSFVCWLDPEGREFPPGGRVVLEKDSIFTAKWDKYPEIEAYDRYFTLEEAQSGRITEEVLLEKVTGSDREDGILAKGRDVTIQDYRKEDFTEFLADGSVSVTYQAVDSFGNVTKKQVMAHVADASMKENPRKSYVRFLGEPFYQGRGFELSQSEGGLEDTSLWRKEGSYRSRLEYALSNQKQQEETLRRDFMGKTYELKKPGSGSWQHQILIRTLEERRPAQNHGS